MSQQPATTPAAAGVVLGAYVRYLRKRCAVRQTDIVEAGIVACPAALSRIEKAMGPLHEQVLINLLQHYGKDVPDTVRRMRGLSSIARSSAHWHEYRDITSDWNERLNILERTASSMLTYENQYIPRLLQTPEYTHALLSRTHGAFKRSVTDDGEVIRRVIARDGHIEMLQGCRPRQTYTAVVDEAVLARPVGGRTVFLDQLAELHNHIANEAPGITVRILPSVAWENISLPGPSATYLQLTSGAIEDMAYLESLRGALYLTSEVEVAWHKGALQKIRQNAATREKSLELVRARLHSLRDRPPPLPARLLNHPGHGTRARRHPDHRLIKSLPYATLALDVVTVELAPTTTRRWWSSDHEPP